MKRLIALRKRTRAFGRGRIEFLHPSNRKVLAFIREWQDEHILVVANLSRFVEYVELDLAKFKGMTAVEMFGRNRFPRIGDLPYLLTLGPHSFYWMSLEPVPERADTIRAEREPVPRVRLGGSWLAALRGPERAAIEAVLPGVLRGRRWFAAKAGRLRGAAVLDTIPIDKESALLFVRADLEIGGAQTYALPIACARGERADALRREKPHAVLVEIDPADDREERGVLFDALEDPEFCQTWLDGVARLRRWKGGVGELVGATTRAFRALRGDPDEDLAPTLLGAEQSNSSVVFGERLLLKLFRQVGEGVNPDLEITRFLTERTRFANIARVAGHLEYRVPRREPVTVGILQAWVPNEGDAWRWSLDRLKGYYQEALTRDEAPAVDAGLYELVEGPPPPPLVLETLGGFLESVRLLGRRTAEMHLALASDVEDPAFAPERYTTLYQRSLYQSLRNLAARVLETLREVRPSLAGETAVLADRLLERQDQLGAGLRSIIGERIDAPRIRCHGDYHLGQVLHTGNDFVIIDFEGEPVRSLGERRLKRSPLRDVAGMLRSFDYAARGSLLRFTAEGVVRPEDAPRLAPWSRAWRLWTSSAFLRSYLHGVEGAELVPRSRPQLETLLDVLLLEKAVYELGYELGSRPDWAIIPLHSILELIEGR
jgi:maltose alpha-D-glucosyltransferase/alpha-amylase